jgi:hypothetical protein
MTTERVDGRSRKSSSFVRNRISSALRRSTIAESAVPPEPEQNYVFNFPPIRTEPAFQGKRKVLIEEDFHPVRLLEADARSHEPRNGERWKSARA